MTSPVKADQLAELLCRVSSRSFRFECEKFRFVAIPQDDWMAVQASRSDLRFLHQHLAGRLEMGRTRCVVFGYEVSRNSPCVDASIAQILTRRELQVAMLVAQGKADKEIARQLGISDHTVREHLRRACAKLSVSKRSALVASIMRPTRTPSDSVELTLQTIDIEGRK